MFQSLYLYSKFTVKKEMAEVYPKNFMKRMGQVIRVLAKHGCGFLVDELRLRFHLPFLYRIRKEIVVEQELLPRRALLILEELGGAYIKLGQLLALRPDKIPQAYCNEFRKLQDMVAPISYGQVKKIVETQLQMPLHKAFSRFSKKPIGSASVAQVHEAQLPHGQKVVVKVQRPHVKETFAADIETMYFIA